MESSAEQIDALVRGIAVGALLVSGLGVWRSDVPRHARIATALAMLSIACWLITESHVWRALGTAYLLLVLSFPVGGLFWLFVAAVFEDRPINALTLSPAAVLTCTGIAMSVVNESIHGPIWVLYNSISALLALHAGFIVLRGWRDDLIDSRRRLRAVIFGASAAFAIGEASLTLLNRFMPSPVWREFFVGGTYGGLTLAVIALGSAAMFLQARPSVFGASRRPESPPDPRAEVADRAMLGQLEAFMNAGGWRTEGLTIGAVALNLDTPEHRLRRLINQRLGHRNFADFINSHRIEAAKRRLADPTEARTTVAAVAFDLGYGSLGPFNRAFRAATGSTPTDWRRQALQTSPISHEPA